MLSESVAKALPLVVGQRASETARFVLMFDRFFDMLNVSNFTNGTRSRKPFLHPYLWLCCTVLHFIMYLYFQVVVLAKWEENVNNRTCSEKSEKKRMLLSDESMLGIRMTGMLTMYSVCKITIILFCTHTHTHTHINSFIYYLARLAYKTAAATKNKLHN